MSQLSTEQLLYLFYTSAYSGDNSITKGDVKSHLPKDIQEKAESLYDSLLRQQLIESPKKSRISVTKNGEEALLKNLLATDYKFTSSKGPKVLNTLLSLLKSASSNIPTLFNEDMDFDTFVVKFKSIYIEERKLQAKQGVVVIQRRDICRKFREQNSISEEILNQYFHQLQSTGQIFTAIGRDDEIINWVE